MRHFTSYGPVNPRAHFTVPRTALVERCVAQLIGAPEEEGGHYFTIWAPRQTGKTWLMRRAIAELRARHGDRFIVGTLSMQGVTIESSDPPTRLLSDVPRLFRRFLNVTVAQPPSFADLAALFQRGTSPFERPVILLVDEFDKLPPAVIDALVGQFRDLYLDRDSSLLHGLALIGVRAVLGVDSPRGSPFNVQRALHVPNLTADEVTEMFRQYQEDSGQRVDPQVVDRIYAVTRGQPGLVGWLGELLTEKYNRDPAGPITLSGWDYVYGAACQVEPNNTILNLLKKARDPIYRDRVVELFAHADVPFTFDQEWCNYLYLNGIIDYQEATLPGGQPGRVCRFSSPFVQLRLYHAFTAEQGELGGRVPVVDPRDDLADVFPRLDLAALLRRYRDYLRRLRQKGINPWQGQPRRADLHLTEAVGHFHLYWWLKEAVGRSWLITPEFPTGNGEVDLHLSYQGRAGVIEVKSFTTRPEMPHHQAQAARYARSRDLSAATLALFVPTDDEDLLKELSGQDTVSVDGVGIEVTTVAIGAA